MARKEESSYHRAQIAQKMLDFALQNVNTAAGRGKARINARKAAEIGDLRRSQGLSSETITTADLPELLKRIHPSNKARKKRN